MKNRGEDGVGEKSNLSTFLKIHSTQAKITFPGRKKRWTRCAIEKEDDRIKKKRGGGEKE